MEKYYQSQKGGSSSDSSGGGDKNPNSNFNWGDYKGLIIGGIVILVLIIVLVIVFNTFGNKKKGR